MDASRAAPGCGDSGAAPAYDEMPIERTSYEVAAVVGKSNFLDGLLRHMKQAGASDLHLSSAMPPMMRLHGDIVPIAGRPVLDADQLMREAARALSQGRGTQLARILPGQEHLGIVRRQRS